MSTILKIILIQLLWQVFIEVESDCYFYVPLGENIWVMGDNLDGDCVLSDLRGGLANTTCPAHPSSSLDQEGEATNWKYYNYGGWFKAELLLCCSTHDLANSKWLVGRGREGQ